MVAGLDHGMQADIMFVIEGTAINGAYLNDLKTSYLIPTLEYFSQGTIEDRDYVCESTSTLYGLVVYHAADILPRPTSDCYGPYSSPQRLLMTLDKLELVGGKGESHANIAEGLATALQAFEDLYQKREGTNILTQKHCILVCNSPPYQMPVMESPSYLGHTTDQLAALLNERGISLSILSPRKIPAMFKLYEKAGGDLSQSASKNYAKDPRHLVLLKGFSLKERPLSPSAPGGVSVPVPVPSLSSPVQGGDGSPMTQPPPPGYRPPQQTSQVIGQPSAPAPQPPQTPQSVPQSVTQTPQMPGRPSFTPTGPPGYPVMRPQGPRWPMAPPGPIAQPRNFLGPQGVVGGGPQGPQGSALIAQLQQPPSAQFPGHRLDGPGMNQQMTPQQQQQQMTPQQQQQQQQQQQMRMAGMGMAGPGGAMGGVPMGQTVMGQVGQVMPQQGGLGNQVGGMMAPGMQGLQPGQGVQGVQGGQSGPQASQVNQQGQPGVFSQQPVQPQVGQQQQQQQQQNPQQQQAGQAPGPGTAMPVRERHTIWQGILEWIEKGKSDNQKVTKHVPCQVSCTPKEGEPDLKADSWPQKLIMQLMPKQLIGSIGGAYLKNSTSVLFHPQHCEALESLTKVMSSGFAGCVHFTSVPATATCDIKVLILLYTVEKRAYLGFIPNDQVAFVERLRKVIQNQKTAQAMIRQNQGNQPGVTPPISAAGPTTSQAGIMTSQMQQTNTMAMQGQMPQGQDVGMGGVQGVPGVQGGQGRGGPMMGGAPQRPPFNHIEAARQQNLAKIQQLQQTLEAAQQQEIQYKSQLEIISHMKIQQLQQNLEQAQQQEMHYQNQMEQEQKQQLRAQLQQMQQRQMTPQQMQQQQQPGPAGQQQQRMLRPQMTGNPGLRHLLQQQPPFRQHVMGMGQRPTQQQPQQFQDDVNNFDFIN